MSIAKLVTASVGGALALLCVYDAGRCLSGLSAVRQLPGAVQSATRTAPEPALVLWLPSEQSDEVGTQSLSTEELPAPLRPNHRAAKGSSLGPRRASSPPSSMDWSASARWRF